MTKKEIVAFLESRRQGHYFCEDSWYTCPKHPEGSCNEHKPVVCDCGADKWNEEIDAFIKRLLSE